MAMARVPMLVTIILRWEAAGGSPRVGRDLASCLLDGETHAIKVGMPAGPRQPLCLLVLLQHRQEGIGRVPVHEYGTPDVHTNLDAVLHRCCPFHSKPSLRMRSIVLWMLRQSLGVPGMTTGGPPWGSHVLHRACFVRSMRQPSSVALPTQASSEGTTDR